MTLVGEAVNIMVDTSDQNTVLRGRWGRKNRFIQFALPQNVATHLKYENYVCILNKFKSLVTRLSRLSGCFWLFAPNFWDVAGTYKWYFVIL